jgi:hypothetical protein
LLSLLQSRYGSLVEESEHGSLAYAQPHKKRAARIRAALTDDALHRAR